MKVLHIITGLNNGGAEGVLFRLCKFDMNHQHIVISMMGEGKYGALLTDVGIEVHYLNMPQGSITSSGLLQLFKLVRAHKPDVVQTWMYHADLIGGIVGKLAGVRSIYWNVRHTTLEPGKSKSSTILVAKLCAFLSGCIPKKIVYCAHESKRVHEDKGYVIGKAELIANGYDLTHFISDSEARASFRVEMSLDRDDILVGMIGRFDAQKDHMNLINALRLLKNNGIPFKLALIGSDIDSNNHTLTDNIAENGLSDVVSLMGARGDIASVMNGFDINVLSSSFGEGFPNVLAEAMACGTPCITTDVGDAALIVGDTGWVVPPNNPEALANAILEAIEEKQNQPHAWLARKKSSRNRIVENFSLEHMLRRYTSVWSG